MRDWSHATLRKKPECPGQGMVVKIVLIIAGTLCDLVALFLTVLIVDMFQHPRGIGAEKIMGPFLGLIAVSLFGASAACFLISSRIKVKPEGQ